MSEASTTRLGDGVTWLIASVLLLALATGVIHAWIGLDFLLTGLTTSALLFLGMALPYFAGVLLYIAGIARRWVVRLGAVYVVVLLGAWLVDGTRDMLAYVTKVIELALLAGLVVLLVVDRRRRLPQLD
jgi:hypothetical protein